MLHAKILFLFLPVTGMSGMLVGADHTRQSFAANPISARAGARASNKPKYTLPPEETSLGDIKLFFAAVAAADTLLVLEGLPHQAFEHEARRDELQRDDIVWFEGHPFYSTPLPLSADERQKLTEIALRPDAHRSVPGLKMCGGFHPDYVVLWKNGGQTSGSLICFGCHEWKNFTPDGRLYEEIEPQAYGELRVILSAYVVNRPKPQRR